MMTLALRPVEPRDELILHGEQAVGRLWTDRSPERIHILDVTVLLEHRGTGIGTTILRALMTEAAAAAQSVTIHVESYNPSLRLVERLGFAQTSVNGAHVLMQWR